MAAKRIRRYHPPRPKLEKAINDILDKAINADSKNAPKQLHLILTTEHPEWKLRERRVAKYLKRQLKERNDMKYKQIDADLDEVSLYSTNTSSNSTWRTSSEEAPAPVPETTDNSPNEIEAEEKLEIPKVSTTSIQHDDSNVANKKPQVATKAAPAPEPAPAPAPVPENTYSEEDNKLEESPLFCDGVNCVIS